MRNNIHDLMSEARTTISTLCVLIMMLLVMAPPVLATEDGAVAQGKTLATERGKGNCLACHMFDDGELPGSLGPPLLAMKLRFPDRGTLRSQICDATVRNSDSRMPPFCRHGILTVEEVELIIDYLYTL
jgi:sulfur-oxidizing protein SoxX